MLTIPYLYLLLREPHTAACILSSYLNTYWLSEEVNKANL